MAPKTKSRITPEKRKRILSVTPRGGGAGRAYSGSTPAAADEARESGQAEEDAQSEWREGAVRPESDQRSQQDAQQQAAEGRRALGPELARGFGPVPVLEALVGALGQAPVRASVPYVSSPVSPIQARGAIQSSPFGRCERAASSSSGRPCRG